MRKFLLLLLLSFALIVTACGADEVLTPAPPPLEVSTLAGPTQPAAESPTAVEPTSPPAPERAEPTPLPTAELMPTPVPGTSTQPGLQPNGRTVVQEVQSVDLDGDGRPEQVVTSQWQQADGGQATLEVAIISPEEVAIYNEKSWEPLDNPSIADAAAMPLLIYDQIEAVQVADLTGDGRPEVVIQRRASGTGQILTAQVLSVTGDQVALLFEGQAYKGLLTLAGEGFDLSQPLYLYNEPNCCPCRRETVRYAWNGQSFEPADRQRTAGNIEGFSCPAFPVPAQWQRIEAANQGPAPRSDAALVFDRSRNRLILFGGRSGNTPLNDTWAFDIVTQQWQEIATSNGLKPPARFSIVAGIDELVHRLIITTGQAGPSQFFDDTWTLDLATDIWRPLEIVGELPAPRYGSAGGIFEYGHALYLGQGFTDQGRYDDLWRLNLDNLVWEELTPDGARPLNRCLHAAAMTGPDSLVLFGGCSSGFGPCPQNDTWAWDGAANAWQQTGQQGGPVARQFPAMALLPDRGTALLFGGQGEGTADLNDTWLLDTLTGVWRQITPEGETPSPRHGHSLTWAQNLDPGMTGSGYAALFGGNSSGGEQNDLWLLLPGDS